MAQRWDNVSWVLAEFCLAPRGTWAGLWCGGTGGILTVSDDTSSYNGPHLLTPSSRPRGVKVLVRFVLFHNIIFTFYNQPHYMLLFPNIIVYHDRFIRFIIYTFSNQLYYMFLFSNIIASHHIVIIFFYLFIYLSLHVSPCLATYVFCVIRLPVI